MIFESLALLTLATTAVPIKNEQKETIIVRNYSSAALHSNAKLEFEDWNANSTLTFIRPSDIEKLGKIENIFVSPIKKSIKVKMKVKIGGKVPPIPVDSEDVVFLDE